MYNEYGNHFLSLVDQISSCTMSMERHAVDWFADVEMYLSNLNLFGFFQTFCLWMCRKFADKVAAAGFVAVVPDYFRGDTIDLPKYAPNRMEWFDNHPFVRAFCILRNTHIDSQTIEKTVHGAANLT